MPFMTRQTSGILPHQSVPQSGMAMSLEVTVCRAPTRSPHISPGGNPLGISAQPHASPLYLWEEGAVCPRESWPVVTSPTPNFTLTCTHWLPTGAVLGKGHGGRGPATGQSFRPDSP